MMSTRRALLALSFLVSLNAWSEERTVKIESARITEYVKRIETAEGKGGDTVAPSESTQAGDSAGTYGDEILRFSGDVVIVVTEGSSVSRIGADEILYDKSRDTLEARGNVTYEHATGKSGGEKYRGEALLFDIKKQEGVFMKGVVTQDSGKKDGDPYIIHAEITGRDSSSTIAFKDAVLTTCDEDEPHWSIDASRVWLLPGNEIAILNGILYIGPLPVFYIPFFYYPGDEMIVHPVFGFRNREGYFVQTTTYFMGRKPLPQKDAKEGTSFSDFLQGDTLKEQRREGLFLRNLPEDAKDADGDYLKLMVDGYSSLGAMIGVDGSFQTSGYVNSVKFLGSVAFSKTLFAPSSGLLYSTYDSLGHEHYNEGVLFGNGVPVRYRTEFSVKMDKKPFQLSMSLPLVSDPEYKDDFFDRSEDLNWFKFLTEQAELARDDDDSDETTYSWTVSGSIKPDMSWSSPWLDTLNVSAISGVLTFNSKVNTTLAGEEALYSPERLFYYPELIKPEIRVSMGGTLLSSATDTAPRITKTETGTLGNPFKEEPAEKETNENDATGDGATEDADDGKMESDDATEGTEADSARKALDGFIPSLTGVITPVGGIKDTSYSVTWGFDPQYVQEIRYSPANWNRPADIDWNDYSSLYYQLKASARLMGKYTVDGDFLSLSSTLSFTGTYQEHPWLSDDVYDTPAKRDAVTLSDYKATVYQIATTDAVKFVPFNHDDLLKPISLAWDFKGDVLKNEFTGTVADPEWEDRPFQWSKDYVSTHTATSVFGVALGPYEQKVTFVNNLPPLFQSYSGTAQFSWLYGSLTMTSKFYEKEVTAGDREWLWDPLKSVLSWSFPVGLRLTQEYTHSIEENEPSRLYFSASYGSLSTYYTMTSTVPYRLDVMQGWVLDGTAKEFVPSDAGLTYDNSSKPISVYRWHNRVYLNLSLYSNLKFDLLRVTNSSFTFSPKLTFKVYDLLDISLSSTSSNEVIARYFQDWMDLPVTLPGETNIVKDLVKSFNFFNKSDREMSGFKLKNMKFGLTHYLHDWTMNLNVTVEPVLKSSGSSYYYDFTPTVDFIVQWKPISDIKTRVRSKEGVFTLNTTDDDDDDD